MPSSSLKVEAFRALSSSLWTCMVTRIGSSQLFSSLPWFGVWFQSLAFLLWLLTYSHCYHTTGSGHGYTCKETQMLSSGSTGLQLHSWSKPPSLRSCSISSLSHGSLPSFHSLTPMETSLQLSIGPHKDPLWPMFTLLNWLSLESWVCSVASTS